MLAPVEQTSLDFHNELSLLDTQEREEDDRFETLLHEYEQQTVLAATSAITPGPAPARAPAPAPAASPAPAPAVTVVAATPRHLQVQGAGTNLCNGAFDRIADISGKPAYASTVVDDTEIKIFWMPPAKAWSISGGGKYLPANKYSVALSQRFERDQYDWLVSTYFEMPAKPHA